MFDALSTVESKEAGWCGLVAADRHAMQSFPASAGQGKTGVCGGCELQIE